MSLLRSAEPADIPQIAALERMPAFRDFVGQWTEERHLATLANPDARYYVVDSPDGGIQAFALLRGLQEASRAIEFKRIVVATPGQGLGRRIVCELLRVVFQDLRAHRFYLDVYEDNARARHLYEGLGFAYEGVMREAGERGDQFISLHLMSMLEREYRALTSGPAG
jgi:RimJ/RimL family protein N-acetyltransferase